MPEHISIHFGPFVLCFSTPSAAMAGSLRGFFTGYICSLTPDVTVEITPADDLPDPVEQMAKAWVPLSVEGNRFDIGPQIITGLVDFPGKTIAISLRHNFFSLPTGHVFQEFLYRLYHTLCRHNKVQSCIIHGCGVIKKSRGYLFIGPHQSGKTTIGQLSDATVLHDDQILLTLHKTGLTMDSPPLAAKNSLRRRPASPVPLDRIFSIMKDTAMSIRPLDAQSALVKLYNEIVLPITLLSAIDKEARSEKAAVCLAILKRASLHELHFDKNGLFWELLAEGLNFVA